MIWRKIVHLMECILVQLQGGCLCATALRLSVTVNNSSSWFPSGNYLKDVFIAVTNQGDVFIGTSFLCSSCLNAATGFYITANVCFCFYIPSDSQKGTIPFA